MDVDVIPAEYSNLLTECDWYAEQIEHIKVQESDWQARYEESRRQLQILSPSCNGTVDTRKQEIQQYQQRIVNGLKQMDIDIQNHCKNLTWGLVQVKIEAKKMMAPLMAAKKEWIAEQYRHHLAPKEEASKTLAKLDGLDQRFEEFGHQLVLVRKACERINNLLVQYKWNNKNLMLELHSACNGILAFLQHFIRNSLIVSWQPPMYLMQSRDETPKESPRACALPCEPEIRLLGGNVLNARRFNSKLTAYLVAEDELRRVLAITKDPDRDPNASVQIRSAGSLSKSSTVFQLRSVAGIERYTAVFPSRITICGKVQRPYDQKLLVSQQRYYILFEIMLTVDGAQVVCYKHSTPIAVLVGPSQLMVAHASLLWFFLTQEAEVVPISSDIYEQGVAWEVAAPYLNRIFCKLTENNKEGGALNYLNEQQMESLGQMIFGTSASLIGAQLKWDILIKKMPRNEMEFFNFLFTCAEMIRKKISVSLCNQGILVPFGERDLVESTLLHYPEPVMWIKFSNSVPKCLLICYYKPNEQKLSWLCLADNTWNSDQYSLLHIVKHHTELSDIDLIYPNSRVSALTEPNAIKPPAELLTGDVKYARRILPAFVSDPEKTYPLPPAPDFMEISNSPSNSLYGNTAQSSYHDDSELVIGSLTAADLKILNQFDFEQVLSETIKL